MDHRPSVELARTIARIDRGFHHGVEIPVNHHISMLSISRRYLWERSVSIPWRSITSNHAAREKVLQNTTLRAVRAMRAIFL